MTRSLQVWKCGRMLVQYEDDLFLFFIVSAKCGNVEQCQHEDDAVSGSVEE